MLFLIGLYYSWPVILVFLFAFAIWAAIRNARSPKVFERRSHEMLRRYQTQISQLTSEINNPSTDIRTKIKVSRDAVDCYARLYAFCSQTKGGKEWFSTACSFPRSQAEKSVADYEDLLAELCEFRALSSRISYRIPRCESQENILKNFYAPQTASETLKTAAEGRISCDLPAICYNVPERRKCHEDHTEPGSILP